jgi:alpha/beta superfamily hydrolase
VPSDLSLTTEDGVSLEAERAVPDQPVAAAVLAHPHPTYGGDMHAGVIGLLFEELPERGVATLRFNFRGVGASTGAHDDGVGEQRDVRAAAAALREAVPDVPLVLAGWSFGADVSMAVDEPDAAGWFAVAPVLAVVDPAEMAAGRDPRPVLILAPEHDQFTPPEVVRQRTASWVNTQIEVVPGADHFLWGRHQHVLDALVRFATD